MIDNKDKRGPMVAMLMSRMEKSKKPHLEGPDESDEGSPEDVSADDAAFSSAIEDLVAAVRAGKVEEAKSAFRDAVSFCGHEEEE